MLGTAVAGRNGTQQAGTATKERAGNTLRGLHRPNTSTPFAYCLAGSGGNARSRSLETSMANGEGESGGAEAELTSGSFQEIVGCPMCLFLRRLLRRFLQVSARVPEPRNCAGGRTAAAFPDNARERSRCAPENRPDAPT